VSNSASCGTVAIRATSGRRSSSARHTRVRPNPANPAAHGHRRTRSPTRPSRPSPAYATRCAASACGTSSRSRAGSRPTPCPQAVPAGGRHRASRQALFTHPGVTAHGRPTAGTCGWQQPAARGGRSGGGR
jgi:hypothetical protein